MNASRELKEKGYAIARAVFSLLEIEVVNSRVAQYVSRCYEGIVTELDRKTVRGIHGLHLYDAFFRALFANRRLLSHAESVLEEQCYVHQSKINMKRQWVGAKWPWHQDFVFWNREDGILSPRLLNVALLLDDVCPDNGPLWLIPSSHTMGDLTDIEVGENAGWEGNVSENLTYQVNEHRVQSLIETHGISYFTGNAGDVLLFDPQLVHSSPPNISSRSRAILFVTYNAVSNRPALQVIAPRPEFICSRSYLPLRQLPDQLLVDDS